MAKKVRLTEEEIKSIEKSSSKKKSKKSKSKVVIIILSIVLLLSIVGNVGTVIYIMYQKSDMDELNSELDKTKNHLTAYQDKYSEANRKLVALIGDSTYDITYKKINFLNENMVFVIKDYGSYYYTYDCMMNNVSGNFSYWAYNRQEAVDKGYKEGTC